MFVPPLYVFAPLRSTVPPPVFETVLAAVSLIAPVTFTWPPVPAVRVMLFERLRLPLKIVNPLVADAPNVRAPEPVEVKFVAILALAEGTMDKLPEPLSVTVLAPGAVVSAPD